MSPLHVQLLQVAFPQFRDTAEKAPSPSLHAYYEVCGTFPDKATPTPTSHMLWGGVSATCRSICCICRVPMTFCLT